MATRKPNGFILYEGPSLLDGAPIVAIAVGTARKSKNDKTGNMLQTFIMRADVEPIAALKTGEDASVCGDCKHRPALGGSCYVNVGQAPLAVYRAYKRGAYPRSSRWTTAQPTWVDIGDDRVVRLGTYGDPAAVPVHVWEALVSGAQGRTGYTHQWNNPALSADHKARLMALVMASCDTPEEAQLARAQGLRYFRVRTPDEALVDREFTCPASAEAGKRTECAQCKACDGTSRPGQASPVIVAHGIHARKYFAIRSAV
jgi:hypothetical protein